MRGLSKSKIMDGLQCPRLLWLKVQHPELVEYPPKIERIFAMGHEVGRVAQELHPGGVPVGARHEGRPKRGDLQRAQAETRRLLDTPGDLTIYEATFSHDGVLVRTDLFFRDGGLRRREARSGAAQGPTPAVWVADHRGRHCGWRRDGVPGRRH